MSGVANSTGPEIAWFGALCDDDYEFLGVAEPARRSTWEHCRDIVVTADRLGFDNVLLPSGYSLGIDSVAFAGAIAPMLEQIRLLVAVRCGELWPPQLARQLATLDQMLGGRLTVNIISSDLPGETLESQPRYRRTLEVMQILQTLLDGRPRRPPRRVLRPDGRPTLGHDRLRRMPAALLRWALGACPRGRGPRRRRLPDVARHAARGRRHRSTTSARARPATAGRCGSAIGSHVIVRETEAEALAAAARLVSKLDDDDRCRGSGTARSTAHRPGSSAKPSSATGPERDGFVEDHLWTGIGRARSGCGAAIVGDPDQVLAKLDAYRALGIDSFILSGYPHIEEAHHFSRLVLDRTTARGT